MYFYELPEKAAQGKIADLETKDFMIISRAHKGFDKCLSSLKSNDAKLAYLRKYAGLLDDDVQKFYNRYMAKSQAVAARLEDSISAKQFCEKNHLNPLVLATHVVFLGKAAIKKVLQYGLGENSPIKDDLDLYSEPFMPDDAQDFVNPGWKPSSVSKAEKNAS